MTVAEWLRSKGKEEGKQEGAMNIVVKMLKFKFGNLPNKYEQLIKDADVSTLNSLTERAFKVNTLQELFETEKAVFS